MTRHRARSWIAVVATTLAFSLALALRTRLDPWLSTVVASVLGIGLAHWALGGARLKASFAVTGSGALFAISLGVLLVVATHAVFGVVSIAWPEIAREVRMLYSTIDSGYTRGTLALITATVVLAEELIWREAAIALLGEQRSRAAVGALAVALYVVPQIAAANPLLALAAIGLGIVFSAQRLVTGRLVDPLLTHGIWSLSIFVLVPLA